GGFVQEHIAALQVFAIYMINAFFSIVLKLCAQLLEADEMGIESSSTDFIPTGFGDSASAKPGQQRTQYHDRSPEGRCFFQKFRCFEVIQINLGGIEPVSLFP